MSKEWDAITYDELYDLFCVKSFPDSMIANMYNVEKRKLQRKDGNGI